MNLDRLLREALNTGGEEAYRALCSKLIRMGYGPEYGGFITQFQWLDMKRLRSRTSYYRGSGWGFDLTSLSEVLGRGAVHRSLQPPPDKLWVLPRWLSFDVAVNLLDRFPQGGVVFQDPWRPLLESFGESVLEDLRSAQVDAKRRENRSGRVFYNAVWNLDVSDTVRVSFVLPYGPRNTREEALREGSEYQAKVLDVTQKVLEEMRSAS